MAAVATVSTVPDAAFSAPPVSLGSLGGADFHVDRDATGAASHTENLSSSQSVGARVGTEISAFGFKLRPSALVSWTRSEASRAAEPGAAEHIAEASVSAVRLNRNAMVETYEWAAARPVGSPLAFDQRTTDSLRAAVGADIYREVTVGLATFRPYAGASWYHDSSRGVTGTDYSPDFRTLPVRFTYAKDRLGTDYAEARVGMETQMGGGLFAVVEARSSFAHTIHQSNGVSGAVRWKFN